MWKTLNTVNILSNVRLYRISEVKQLFIKHQRFRNRRYSYIQVLHCSVILEPEKASKPLPLQLTKIGRY